MSGPGLEEIGARLSEAIASRAFDKAAAAVAELGRAAESAGDPGLVKRAAELLESARRVLLVERAGLAAQLAALRKPVYARGRDQGHTFRMEG